MLTVPKDVRFCKVNLLHFWRIKKKSRGSRERSHRSWCHGQVHPGELCSATRHSAWSQLCCRSAAWPQLCCRSAAWPQLCCRSAAWPQLCRRSAAWPQHGCRSAAWPQLCCRCAAWRRLRYRGAAAAAASLSHFAAAAQPPCHCRDTARCCRSPPFTAAAPQRPSGDTGSEDCQLVSHSVPDGRDTECDSSREAWSPVNCRRKKLSVSTQMLPFFSVKSTKKTTCLPKPRLYFESKTRFHSVVLLVFGLLFPFQVW